MNHIHPLRIQPAALEALHHSPDGSTLHQHLQSLPPGLQSLDAISPDPSDGLFQRYLSNAQVASQVTSHAPHALNAPNPFEHDAGLPHAQNQFQAIPPSGYQHPVARFNLIPAPPHPTQQHIQAPPPPSQQIAQQPPRIQQRLPDIEPQTEFVQPQAQSQSQSQGQNQDDDAPVTNHGQFEGLKLIPNPPNLDEWRDKLFHVDDTITLTEDEYVHRECFESMFSDTI